MSSPISLPAVHPNLAFHVRGDRPLSIVHEQHRSDEAVSEDGDEGEDVHSEPEEQEREVREMLDDDEAYQRSMTSDQGDGQDFDAGNDIPRTSSPEAYDVEPAPAASERQNGPSSIFKRTNTLGGRTVTIEEPTLSPDVEKGSSYFSPTTTTATTKVADSLSRRRRASLSLSAARSDTIRSVSSFSSTVSTAWEKRHDSSHAGLWRAVWTWIVGKKEADPSRINPDDPDYVPPKYRWTPILSGLLQPFSILLEIPGLTEHWYVHTVNNVPVVYQANPALLDIGLAISMASAVVANIALISRFLERRVLASTITTIVGLTIHDIINLVAVITFGVIHSVDDGFTYSEAFWLCVCSTAASTITNATLIYDLVKTKDFGKSGSGLTPKQRSLVIISMLMLVYLAVGAMCFNFLLPATSFQNALYFTVVSIETIGFGDITPYTLGAKIFLFFYAPVGILNLAVAVGTARDTLVESWNAAYRRRRHEVLRRHRIRKQQRTEEAAKREAIERKLAELGKPVYVSTRGGGIRGGAKGKKLNIRGLSVDQRQEAESEAMSALASKSSTAPDALVSPTGETFQAAPAAAPSSVSASAASGQDQGQSPTVEANRHALDEAMRLQAELTSQSLMSEEGYQEFQERMAREERTENLVKFAFALSIFVLFWIVGATVFCKTEKWSWFIAFYFCFVAFTTIGYGEVSPQTPAGRAFFIIWAIFGVATVTLLIAVLTEAYANRYKSALVRKGTKKAIEALKERSAAGAPGAGNDKRERAGLSGTENGNGNGNGDINSVLPAHDAEHREKLDRLPHEIIALLRKFHTHVSASRHGAMEGHESEPTRQLVAQLLDEQGVSEVEKGELMGDPESRRVVFWNGYERAVNALLVHAQSLLHHTQATTMAEDSGRQRQRIKHRRFGLGPGTQATNTARDTDTGQTSVGPGPNGRWEGREMEMKMTRSLSH